MVAVAMVGGMSRHAHEPVGSGLTCQPLATAPTGAVGRCEYDANGPDGQPETPAMRFADFLIIGAMKAGTTTVYRDLAANPQVFFPRDKEPGNLASDEVLTDAGRRRYAAIFAAAGPDQRCGDASTDYAKLPDIPGVAARAAAVCGSDLRVVYSVREPVARLLSQHHHEATIGLMPEDLGQALRQCPRLLDYSRYAMQIQPWIERFGPQRVKVIRFEDYTADRRAAAADLCAFLSIESRPQLIDCDAVFNKSDSKPAARGLIHRLSRTGPYQRLIRPLLSQGVKDRLRATLLPKAPPRTKVIPLDTLDFVLGELADDLERLTALLERDRPVWDVDAVRQRYTCGP